MRDGYYRHAAPPGYRFSIEIIRHAVWHYHRFSASLRDIEEMLAYRGIQVTYETIRAWCDDFGPDFASEIRKRRAQPGSMWNLDECVIKIKG